jgi:hypothetical protein
MLYARKKAVTPPRSNTPRGCPQGHMLSPLMWSAVMNKPVWGLNEGDYYMTGYENDTAILINRKFTQTVSEMLQ